MTTRFTAAAASIAALLFAVPALAQARLTFVIGDVTVKTPAGEVLKAKTGDMIPRESVVKTSPTGRASLFDTITSTTTMVQPNSEYKYTGLSKPQMDALKGMFFNGGGIGAMRGGITSVAGVRGYQRPMPCQARKPYVLKTSAKHKAAWAAFEAGKADEVLKLVGAATDDEAAFLRGAATLDKKGLAALDAIAADLKIAAQSKNFGIKTEAEFLLTQLEFNSGALPQAAERLGTLNKAKQAKDIDEQSYYMLIKINRDLGRADEERKHLKNADQFCKDSKLIQGLKAAPAGR